MKRMRPHIRLNKHTIILICCVSVFFKVESQQFLELYGPYFGQTPPGTTPEVFADGIISGNALHATPVFSPDGDELYWNQTIISPFSDNIYFSRMINNQWTVPETVSFSSSTYDDNPIFSPDGQTLFFNSFRPVNGNSKERIWYVHRIYGGSWSDPIAVDPVVNDYQLHWQVGVDPDGTIYFQSDRSPSYGQGDLFYSEFQNGHFQNPINMGPTINTNGYDSMPYIDPENRFIIYCNDTGINISEKQQDGSWTQPQSITAQYPQINGTCPQITPDGEYFFYTIINNLVSTVYWVDAQFIFDNYTGVDRIKHSTIPQKVVLHQNYPNPFNPATSIPFDLESPATVTLNIYSLNGKLMRTLCKNQMFDTGYQTVYWNGKTENGIQACAGVYLYRIQADKSITSRKMLLLK